LLIPVAGQARIWITLFSANQCMLGKSRAGNIVFLLLGSELIGLFELLSESRVEK